MVCVPSTAVLVPMLSPNTGPPSTCQYWPEDFGKKRRVGVIAQRVLRGRIRG